MVNRAFLKEERSKVEYGIVTFRFVRKSARGHIIVGTCTATSVSANHASSVLVIATMKGIGKALARYFICLYDKNSYWSMSSNRTPFAVTSKIGMSKSEWKRSSQAGNRHQLTIRYPQLLTRCTESTDPEFDDYQRHFTSLEQAAEKLIKDTKAFSEGVTGMDYYSLVNGRVTNLPLVYFLVSLFTIVSLDNLCSSVYRRSGFRESFLCHLPTNCGWIWPHRKASRRWPYHSERHQIWNRDARIKGVNWSRTRAHRH